MEATQTDSQKKLLRDLDIVMIPWIGMVTVGTILILLILFIPIFQANQYIVNPILMCSFQILCSLILVVSKSQKYQDQDSKKESRSQSSHGPTSHVESTPSIPYRSAHPSSPRSVELQSLQSGSRRLIVPEDEPSTIASVSHLDDSRLEESKHENNSNPSTEISIQQSNSRNSRLMSTFHQTSNGSISLQPSVLPLIPAEPELEDQEQEQEQSEQTSATVPVKKKNKVHHEGDVWVQ